MKQLVFMILLILAGLGSTFCFAGTVSISENGARNIGSSLAYIALCEKKSFLPAGTLSSPMIVMQKSLTVEAWQRIKNQYQKSLHDKKQYSISADRWIPFEINATNCSDLEEVIPMLEATLKNWGRSDS